MTDIPIVMTPAGAQPISPADLRDMIIALVTATNPGYTATLPGSMIDDICGTDVAALALIDSAMVELIDSLTPYGANLFILNQLGYIYGVIPDQSTNTSVNVVFTGSPGFVIAQGFVVSDGTNQYTIKDGGVVASGGVSPPLYAVATQTGTWPVPANTVNQLITSVPSTVTLSVNNPIAGTPSTTVQTPEDYRAQVLQAGLASSMGMGSYLKTLLYNVPGVNHRLVSVRQQSPGWEVIVGGGDPYEVAYAIFMGLFDISTLVGSTLSVVGISNTNPGVVTTDLNTNLSTGDVITIEGVAGMTGINGVPFTITRTGPKTFSIGIDTTGLGTYTGGGVITPNPRNATINIYDAPDTYNVVYVQPPQQSVRVNLTWNTDSPNYVNPSAIAQLGSVAIVDYINSIPVGQPINLFELQNAFQLAVLPALPTELLTRMVFDVYINAILTPPIAGTGIIEGDPESYFETNSTLVSIVQG
jgi:hypothetical protein